MQQPTNPAGGDGWGENQAMELWKYFGGVGAADKNTMVTVESLLLGFSSALIGYVVTNLLCFSPLSVHEPFKGLCVALLGTAISVAAGYVSLLYGGYSNWNWAQADAIARDQAKRDPKWDQFLPEKAEEVLEKWRLQDKPSPFCAIALKRGRPCYPTKQLAPIFCLYLWLAIAATLFHLSILVPSILVLLAL
jgi:hypothetical protein